MLEKKSLSLKVKANCLHSQRYLFYTGTMTSYELSTKQYNTNGRRKKLERLVRFEFVSVVAEVFNVSLFYVH